MIRFATPACSHFSPLTNGCRVCDPVIYCVGRIPWVLYIGGISLLIHAVEPTSLTATHNFPQHLCHAWDMTFDALKQWGLDSVWEFAIRMAWEKPILSSQSLLLMILARMWNETA
jgi:hypothetical protein